MASQPENLLTEKHDRWLQILTSRSSTLWNMAWVRHSRMRRWWSLRRSLCLYSLFWNNAPISSDLNTKPAAHLNSQSINMNLQIFLKHRPSPIKTDPNSLNVLENQNWKCIEYTSMVWILGLIKPPWLLFGDLFSLSSWEDLDVVSRC